MSETISQDRKDALDYRTAEIVAYVTERIVSEFSDVQVSAIMKSIYHSNRYKQIADYNTYLYTYTFDELYQLFVEEFRADRIIK